MENNKQVSIRGESLREILDIQDEYPRSVKTETSGFIDAKERFVYGYHPLSEEDKKKLNENLKKFHENNKGENK